MLSSVISSLISYNGSRHDVVVAVSLAGVLDKVAVHNTVLTLVLTGIVIVIESTFS